MLLYNSLTNKKHLFVPLRKKKVSLYVCGITPYDTTHLGHAFTYISFDVLVRYLKYKGYKVNYTQNVTDINDRDRDILQRAREQKVTWRELADFWTKRFLEDMSALNWVMPTNYVNASESLEAMFALIQKLLENGLAYKTNGSVYLNVFKDKGFGKLSKFDKTKMLRIAREFDEDVNNPDKTSPLDITLWRSADIGQAAYIPSFASPFGKGRPGWHIECSAMSMSTLGEQIDIHGGGIDLIYPHHESEIAQSEGACGKIPFAQTWMHTGSVGYKGKKMSKSEKNMVMVPDLSKSYSSNALRWMLLSHHYRAPWEFFEKDLGRALKIVRKLEEEIKNKDLMSDDKAKWKKFESYMDDDMNVPSGLELIIKAANEGDTRFAKEAMEVLGFKLN